MKKKLFSLFLVLAMVLTILPTAALADELGGVLADESASQESTETVPLSNDVDSDEPETTAEENPPACNPGPNCPLTATTGHQKDCSKACTNDESCGNTKYAADIHGELCPYNASKKPAEENPKTPTGDNDCDHSWGAYTADNSEHTRVCSKCKTKETQPHIQDKTAGVAQHDTTTHTYKCSVCEKNYTEKHDYKDGKCTVCGFVRYSPAIPSYRDASITDASVGSRSISLSGWANLYSGQLKVYVDGYYQQTISTSASGYFSTTVYFSYYLKQGHYNLHVRSVDDSVISNTYRVYNPYYDHDYDYRYPSYSSPDPHYTPSTNSYGIPYASEVKGPYTADEAITTLSRANSYELQRDLMNSSSALSSFESLESKVKSYNTISVAPDVRSGAPSAIRNASGSVSVVGAAFNASRGGSVRLKLDAPSQVRYAGHGYQFSMTLTGVSNASSLKVPVVVTLPLPSDINSNYVQVLHYHGSGSPTVISPKVSGRTITFPLTGFSDFVITDNAAYYAPGYVYNYGYNYGYNYSYVSDGYGGYVPVASAAMVGVPASSHRNLVDEHLRIILPILASMPPSGYVYDDVAPGHWAATQIAWAKDGGLMSGYFDGTFRPSSGTTRQELWMVLARLAGANPADMEAARVWVVGTGISDGTNPHSPLSTQQMIAMLYRYAQYRGLDTSTPSGNLALFRDGGTVSSYARTPMSWAVNWGIVSADGSNCLNPQNIATRADFAVYLYRFLS